ncbi:hypothetical protein A6A08_12910 [Nocardiopsis sp. TSRI0078]|uniref:hypothetical protein n=1 Tax=unclassified Nocardiopsis TaxID=2649073 RepID=UPI000940459E|nr:hypothetical protein [Nocardiopsis sp. TSRI0078]OKI14473.1 hypothetical protein A6A08_12910 [Nocardiopsis sp. TSRI0078]
MNATEAYAGGDASLTAASRLRDLADDWSEAVEDVEITMGHLPGVTGWSSFGTEQETHMQDVQDHARTLATNIQAAASEGEQTDIESAEYYRSTSSSPILNRAVNGRQF